MVARQATSNDDFRCDLEAVNELVDEFWVRMHFETRRICSWYQAQGQSLPVNQDERGVIGALSRVIGVEYARRASALRCPQEVFLCLLDERKERMYRRTYEPESFN